MTDYLFAKPNFVGGMARALDLGGTLSVYNESATPESADSLAMKSDWEMVGADLVEALTSFTDSHAE